MELTVSAKKAKKKKKKKLSLTSVNPLRHVIEMHPTECNLCLCVIKIYKERQQQSDYITDVQGSSTVPARFFLSVVAASHRVRVFDWEAEYLTAVDGADSAAEMLKLPWDGALNLMSKLASCCDMNIIVRIKQNRNTRGVKATINDSVSLGTNMTA